MIGNTEHVVAKDENNENVPKLEIVDLILMHCNIVDNKYQQATKVLFTLVPNKQFRQLLFHPIH